MAQLSSRRPTESAPPSRLEPSRRRVVVFSPGHDEVGGAARRSRLLAAALAGRGWQVRVITRAGTRRGLAVRRSANLLVVELPGFGSRRLGAALFLAVGVPLGVVFGARSPVFLAIQLVSPTSAAALCAALLRRPFVAMATTSGQLSEAAFLMEGRLSALRRPLVRRAAYLAGQTQHVATELATVVDRERIVVLPNPVQAVDDAPPLTGAPRVVYTGRLSEEKDLGRLLEAWRVVAEHRPGAMLTLVGDGGRHRPVEHELRRSASADALLRETVQFTGWVADVGPFLAGADVYVLPSLTEGMSNSLLEACAWRRVVVASAIPANVEVLGEEYPLLFAAGDTDSLIGALRRALDDETIRRDAVDRIVERMSAYSVDSVVAKLEGTLESAVLGRAPR
jgi:glycosyltransferase involved in cell wall biosynthesis